MGTVNASASHRVRLSHKRVMAASIEARSRPMPSFWWYALALLLVLVLIFWAGNLLVFWFVQQLPFEWMFAIGPYLPLLIPPLLIVIGIIAVNMLYDRLGRRAYLRHMKRLNVPLEIDAVYEVLPEGLRLTTERIEIFPKWPAIDTITRVADGWVISADQLTFLVPADSFPDKADEQAFLAAIVAHLEPQARARSRQAVAFAETAPSAS